MRHPLLSSTAIILAGAGGTGQSSIPLREHRRGAKVLFCRFVLGSGSWAAWLNVWD